MRSSALFVAPLVGAWIEISDAGALLALVPVAPLVGAWIEIPFTAPTGTG